MEKLIFSLFCILLIQCSQPITQNETKAVTYDLVLQNGRFIDPASQTDAILNIAIQADTIAAIRAIESLIKE